MMGMSPWHVVLVALAGWLNREQQKTIEYLKEENRVLREQLGAKRLPFNDEQQRRLAVKGKELGIKMLRELGCIVTPDTILRWYRELIAMKYDGSEHRRPAGRVNRTNSESSWSGWLKRTRVWGYTRIRDALGNLGHEIARNTIKAILTTQGIEPAPERSKRISWKTFLRSHWAAIAACDFFTVEVLTWTGLTRFYVLFVIALETRRVEIAGIIRQPHGAWMLQIARNLIDSVDGFLTGQRFLLLDRDPLYTSQFRALLASAGVTPIRLPPSSPNLNAYAERFVRSIKSECLNKLVLLGEGHLRAAVREYERGFPRAKALVGTPNARFDGVLSVNGEAVDVGGWIGSQNHNWGSRHTDSYAWGQVAGFDDAPRTFLECSTARLKLGPFWTPPMTVLVLRLEDREIRVNSLTQAFRARGEFDFPSWRFESRAPGLRVSGTVHAPKSLFAGLAYNNPPGGAKTCLNTKLAACELTVEEVGRPPRMLSTKHRAAFEILTERPDHGVPVLV
jgi:transposase InsO family protein